MPSSTLRQARRAGRLSAAGALLGLPEARLRHVTDTVLEAIVSSHGQHDQVGMAMQTQAELNSHVRDVVVALREDARTDGLTGLANRRATEERLLLEVQRTRRFATPLAVLLVDVDRLKLLNDTHGHSTGDAALRAVATGLRSAVRSVDLVGRLGGDEFCLVAPGTDELGAATLAGKLEALPTTVTTRHRTLSVTITAGWCVERGVGIPAPDELLEQADEAMYRRRRLRRGA